MKDDCPKDLASAGPLVSMAFVGVLSPMVRRYPRDLARIAGRCGWLCPLLAAPFAGLLLLLMGKLFRNGRSGLPRRMEELLGFWPARLFSGLTGFWLLFYTGFLLRAGALRMVSAAYPDAAPELFSFSMALACGWCAGGGMRSVSRCAAVLRPLLAAVLLFLPLLALKDADFHILLPVTAGDLFPALGGGLGLVNLLAGSVLPVLISGVDREAEASSGLRCWAAWGGVLLLLLSGITAACLGFFGPDLTGQLSYPLFMLARDVNTLGSLERTEPLLVALWVLSDFVFLSALLRAAVLAFAYAGAPKREFPPGRMFPVCCALAAFGISLLLPQGTGPFAFLSEKIVPLSGAVVGLGIPLLTLAVGTLRRKV